MIPSTIDLKQLSRAWKAFCVELGFSANQVYFSMVVDHDRITFPAVPVTDADADADRPESKVVEASGFRSPQAKELAPAAELRADALAVMVTIKVLA